MILFSASIHAAKKPIKTLKNFSNFDEYTQYIKETIASSEQCSNYLDAYNDAIIAASNNYGETPNEDEFNKAKEKCLAITDNATKANKSAHKIVN